MPTRTTHLEKDEGRPLMLIDEPLGFEMTEHVAGNDAAAFCQGYDTYMLRELKSGMTQIK